MNKLRLEKKLSSPLEVYEEKDNNNNNNLFLQILYEQYECSVSNTINNIHLNEYYGENLINKLIEYTNFKDTNNDNETVLMKLLIISHSYDLSLNLNQWKKIIAKSSLTNESLEIYNNIMNEFHNVKDMKIPKMILKRLNQQNSFKILINNYCDKFFTNYSISNELLIDSQKESKLNFEDFSNKTIKKVLSLSTDNAIEFTKIYNKIVSTFNNSLNNLNSENEELLYKYKKYLNNECLHCAKLILKENISNNLSNYHLNLNVNNSIVKEAIDNLKVLINENQFNYKEKLIKEVKVHKKLIEMKKGAY